MFFKNIDVAFFRRFLFKIRFDNPDKDILKQIFKSKLPWLGVDYLDSLSTIELSGGEIDNVVTKIIMHEVIHSERPSLELMKDFCIQENMDKRKANKLGFN